MAGATIKDVAKEAGVSISTVSYVINGTKPVSERLAHRVRAAVAKLDFHPNHMARLLNSRRSRTLAFLTPDISNVGFVRIFKAIDAIARARGYTLFLLNTDGSLEMTQRAIGQVLQLKMDGVFLTLSWALTHPSINLSILTERGIAAVGVSGANAIDGIDCFLWDEEGAGQQLGRYLNRLGHHRILCVGPESSLSGTKRWGGVRREFPNPGESVVLARTPSYAAEGGYKAVRNAIAAAESFSAVIAFNDAIATGALAALYDQGLVVPRDISFVSFGDHHRDYSRPQITSMTFDEDRIAELAANRLIGRIEKSIEGKTVHEYLPLTLSIQPSSRKFTAD